jgi:gliding motility-associated-like protein
MAKKKLLLLFTLFILGFTNVVSQNVTLYKQFGGRVDFTFIGNTLNPEENSFMITPTVLTTSSANLALKPSDIVLKAYLYWSGSGTGDFDVKLNNVNITPDRKFSYKRVTLDYFSAFTDVTQQIQSTGNGLYTLSEFDVSSFIVGHFENQTNFAGWAIVIVYENSALPINLINVYDGLQAVPSVVDITLNSLNVIDNQDAKIGFLAWEGDTKWDFLESLKINGNLISNPPLNPATNAFNGTNSITGSNTLYNMDLDVYNIQNNINIGDVSAQIQLTSGKDFVMINAIITKLNSQLPDATVKIENIVQTCNSRDITVNYTVSNLNSTNFLPSGTYITIYADNQAIATTQTTQIIPIGGSSNYQTIVTIPNTIPIDFDLKIIVDDNKGVPSVTEIVENNNTFNQAVTIWLSPEFNILEDITQCIEKKGVYDFSSYETLVKKKSTDIVAFFKNYSDATANTNPITNTLSYETQNSSETIYVRIDNEHCYTITQFNLVTKFCNITYYNFFVPNGNNFFIEGIVDVYPNYEISVYNRWGVLVWKGNKNIPNWDGTSNQGLIPLSGTLPTGTYYYVLNYNDPAQPENKVAWVYLSR